MHSPVSASDTTPTFYFKLPYIGPFSVVTQKRVRHFADRYCYNIDIKLVFSSFKIGNIFGVKDPNPCGLHACVVNKFCMRAVMPVISAKPHGIYPHVSSDRTSHIFRHLQNSQQCRTLFNPLSLRVTNI